MRQVFDLAAIFTTLNIKHDGTFFLHNYKTVNRNNYPIQAMVE